VSGSQEENLPVRPKETTGEPQQARQSEASAQSIPPKSPSRPPGETATAIDPKSVTVEPARTALTGVRRDDAEWKGLIVDDKWKLVERIGKGGMSVVYKAQHMKLGKPVAVKLLLPHLIHEDMLAQKRFEMEAKAASSLSHPNVITVHDCGMTPEGEAFIIMDYLDGESLSDYIEFRGPLPPEQACDIFFQTANGLQHAHSKGVIHRDLKPSNLMLVQSDYHLGVKIVDFGIAKVTHNYEAGVAKDLTKTGDVFGSPYYMSPEQCQGKRIDSRSDIYSMGCLMYETLNGEPPFIGDNPLDSMYRHIHNDSPWLVKHNSPDSLLKRLDEIIQKCLEKNPADRYQTAGDLAVDLAKARDASARDWRAKSLAARTYRARQHRGDLTWRIAQYTKRALPAVLVLVAIAWFCLETDSSSSFSKYKSYRTAALTEMLEPPHIVAEQLTPEDEVNIDSLARFEERVGVTSYTTRITSLHNDANYYQKRGDWAKAAAYWDKGAQLTLKESQRPSIFQANDLYKAGLCNYYVARSTPAGSAPGKDLRRLMDQKAITVLLVSINIINDALFRLINNGSTNVLSHPSSTMLVEPLSVLSYAEEDAGDLSRAAAVCHDVLRLNSQRLNEHGERFKIARRFADLERRIGTTTHSLSTLESAREAYQQALGLASAPGLENDDYTLCKTHYGLGLTLKELANISNHRSDDILKEADENLKESISLGRNIADPRFLGTMQVDYADVLWRRGDIFRAIQLRFDALASFHKS